MMTPQAPDPGKTPDLDPTSLYRYYDAVGVLIYVGITRRGVSRNFEHAGSKEWWPFVATQTVEHFDTRAEALRRERDLIRQYRPPFNKQHNPDHARMREAYLTISANVVTERDVEAYLKTHSKRHVMPLQPLRLAEDSRDLQLVTELEHQPIAARLVQTRPPGRVIFGHHPAGKVAALNVTPAISLIQVQPIKSRRLPRGEYTARAFYFCTSVKPFAFGIRSIVLEAA